MKTFNIPTRVWVNCPSTNYWINQFHGRTAIAWTKPNGKTCLYFDKGDLYSVEIPNTLHLETRNSHTNVFEFSK
jgi:hypothetical protein